jgi:hypothetical protein
VRIFLIIFYLILQSFYGITQNVIQQKVITKEGPFMFEGKIIKDSTEGYWIVGNIVELGVRLEYLIIRLNEDLSINWSKSHRGYFSGSFVDLVQLSDQNYLAFGYVANDMLYFTKFNSQGDTLWTKFYSNSPLIYSAKTINNQLFITTSRGLISLNADGELNWAKFYSGTLNGFNILPISDTTALLVGGWVAKIDTRNGDLYWLRRFKSTSSTLWYYDICPSNEEKFIIRGNGEKPYLFKIDADGNVLWSKVFNYPEKVNLGSIISTSDNNYILTGNYGNANNLTKSLIIKFNDQGDTLYTATYGGEKMNYGFPIVEKPNGSLVYLQTSNSFTSNHSFYINEFSADGLMQCNQLDIYPLSIEDVDLTYEERYFISDVNLVLDHMEMEIFDVALKDSIICSNVISVPEIAPSENTVKIYPNPSSGNFKIEMEVNAFYEVEVFNFLGKKVFSTAASSSVLNVNLHNQPRGIYFVKVQSSGRSSFYKVQRQ